MEIGLEFFLINKCVEIDDIDNHHSVLPFWGAEETSFKIIKKNSVNTLLKAFMYNAL